MREKVLEFFLILFFVKFLGVLKRFSFLSAYIDTIRENIAVFSFWLSKTLWLKIFLKE
jgi:hypothetical protein